MQEMRLQVLVATMNQTDHSLLERMNIQSDAIVINQCERNEIEEVDYNGHTVKWMSFVERGVGLSRNTALMRSDADIALFADDDVVYDDGYASIITDAFNRYRKADAVMFNLRPPGEARKLRPIKEGKSVGHLNCFKYGIVHIAVKVSRIRRENIAFSLLFGGGAVYGSGEDTLFIMDCLKRGLKIRTCSAYIGGMIERESCWFRGYNEKYLFDKGALFRGVSKLWAKPLCMQFLLRHNEIWKSNGIGFFKAYKLMRDGIKDMSRR